MAKDTLTVKIKNKKILDKLQQKTGQDAEMYNFLIDILNWTANGKQFHKHYGDQIEKYAESINLNE